jgi:RHS repeat-associated protein
MALNQTNETGSKDADMKESRAPQSSGEREKNAFAAPTISLPKGGGAIRGIGEKFAANPVTGTGSMTVPIVITPGRSGFSPQLALSYDSGSGNGPFGLGWNLSLPAITRKTDKGLPKYQDAEESDVFILAGAEDLAPVLLPDGARFKDDTSATGYVIHRYRPRVEGLFTRIERWTKIETGEIHWRSITRDNITTLYGKDNNSRIVDPADPDQAHPTRVFGWLICQSYDDKGSAIVYEYQREDSQRIFEDQHGQFVALARERNRDDTSRKANHYLKRIKYGNRTPNRNTGTWQATDPAQFPNENWMFEVVFDYGEGHYAEDAPDAQGRIFARTQIDPPAGSHWPVRQDPFSTYRAGFEVRAYRLCRRVLMFHHFSEELGMDDYLVRSTEFEYKETPIASFITSITQSSYVRQNDGAYLKKSLPPLEFSYSKAEIQDEVHEIDPFSLENLPYGLDGARYQWVDLDGEGISGILTEQAESWFYKPNFGGARFGPVRLISPKPSIADLNGAQQLIDLAGDGQLDLAQFAPPLSGFYERTHDGGWSDFMPFTSLPKIDWSAPYHKYIDLTGDGHTDILNTEDDIFTWYPSLAEEGFGRGERVRQSFDEEKAPRLVFAEATQTIFLADMSGDGLTDLARIRNGEVCYWPNLGYGRFGAKVTMDDSPWFDTPDLFDPGRIRLADIDGSGVTDIIYLGRDGVHFYFNQSGNSWSEARTLEQFPRTDNLSSVTVVDLLGNGTACLVWSSPLPGHIRQPMRYIELMKQKPHLMVETKNNLGAETRVEYVSSTKFYLADKAEGTPWITRLPFPVHVVEMVETLDRVSRNRFITRYKYHHGYFDGVEREFRGFGMVEQLDTEEFAALSEGENLPEIANIDAASHVPPVRTKTWFHTGVYTGRERISDFFAGLIDGADTGEYYREPGLTDEQVKSLLLPDTALPEGLSIEEEREACRALKGAMLRQEVYADDAPEGASEEVVKRAQTPYTITEQNFTIERLQPRSSNRHAVFFTHPREVISYHYERNSQDPRMTHAMTLEVDPYGNVLKSLTIGYGRKQSPLPEQRDRDKQTTTLVTYTENWFTNAIDDQIKFPDSYRAPFLAEARTYELTGFKPENNASQFSYSEFTKDNFALLASAVEIPYEQTASANQKQKRLIEHVRTLYRKDDLSGLLALGAIEPLSLPGENYKLALTPGLLDSVFKRKRDGQPDEALLPADPTSLLTGKGADQGGYVLMDGAWWIPSGKVFFDPDADITNPALTAGLELAEARLHFFLPRKFTDPFGQSARVNYDPHDLLIISTQDALGNRVESINDYRVLQPRLVIDPNRNRTEVKFDALGMVAGTAVMGKEGQNLGDLLEGFDPDPTQAQIDGLVAKPREPSANPSESEVTQIVRDLLQNATTRIVYDLDRFRRLGEPPFASTIAREKHVSDLADGEQSRLQVSFSYSDGFGREIQKKIQAEPGPISEGGPITNPRWVGSGWTIFNNKGKPVRRYEPFFSSTHQFEFAKIAGVSATLFYDPVERVIATLHPNNTYEKAVFDSWRQKTYDVNDTVALDPRTDADIAGYVKHYFAAQPASWQTWRDLRKDGQLGEAEKDTAEKTVVHADTPTTVHLDTLGRIFQTIAHNRFERNGAIIDEKYVTRVLLDIEGNQREVRDAKDRAVMRYDYDLLGARIHQASMEAGERWMLNDVTSKPIRAWDSRRFIRRMAYDELRRPTRLFVNENGAERLAERTVYGENLGDAGNHRMRAHQVFDGAGVVTSEVYDFKGNLRRGKRELLADYKQAVNWLQNPLPNGETFTSATTYDALNRPLAVTTPDGSVYRSTFNEANLLDRIAIELHGAAATPFVTNIAYNAKGQRELIAYGNGARTTYKYDPLTFRLVKLTTTRPANPDVAASELFNSVTLAQDLGYTYDPAGNITRIQDAALKTVVHDQEQVDPVCGYRYDSIYRLIEAKGREHLGQTAIDFDLPNNNLHDRDYPFFGLRDHSNDAQAMRNYTERYEYDEVGAFKVTRHTFKNGSWIRSYDYQEVSLLEPATHKSNRLTSTTAGNGGAFPETYTYNDANGNDVHGCITSINSMKMVWDFKDRLQQVDLGGGGAAYYVYDASGQRVRKVIETQNGTRQNERIYLGDYEVYREYNGGGGAILERETLHVMDDKQRIALVETKTIENGNAIIAPLPAPRYQLGNHLGSASLELDADGKLISYEEYHPYGTTAFQVAHGVAEVSLKRYRYTGKERDEESGLCYYGARYYAPWVGRWVSCDPTGISDGVNVYAYVTNRPMNHLDPDGRANAPIHEHLTKIVALQYVDSDTADKIGEAANAPDVGLLNETLLHSVAGDPGESNEKVHVLWRGSREEKIKSTIEAYKKSGDKTIKGAGKDLLHPIQDANYHVSKYTFGPGLGHGLFPEADLAVGEKTFDEFYQVVTDTQEGVKLAKERGAFGNHSHPALKKEISKQKWEKIYTDLKAIERKYEFIFKLLNIIGIGSHLGPVMGSLGGMGGGIVGAVIGGIGGFFVGLFTGKNVLKGMESGAKIGFKIGFNSLQAIVGGIAGYGAGLLMPIAKDRLRIKVAGEQDNYLKEKRSQIQEES